MYEYNDEYVPTTVILKDQTITTDPRLDRVKQFDQKSRNYRAVEGIEDKKPRSFTWRVDLWLNQGREGACFGFGAAHELKARPVVIDVDEIQARKIYYRAQQLDPWEGGEYEGASPRYAGTSILAGCKAMQELKTVSGQQIMPEYRWAFGVEDLILSVGYKGPAILGINWYTSMYKPDEDGFIKPGGALAGGHAILANAIRVVWKKDSAKKTIDDMDWDKSYFTLHNSWGKSWGDEGRCRITVRDMDRLLQEDGEAVIPVVRLSRRTKNRRLAI